MNKKIIVIPIAIVIGILTLNFSLNPVEEKNTAVFHITLADPNLYSNGVFTDTFVIDKGEYLFRFVPNGSSPDILSITLTGEKFNFSQDFHLKGIPHQTGISEYFTWEYGGEKTIFVSEMQEISITINPNGKVMGSVSVDILEN
jgi:hypothetical protein